MKPIMLALALLLSGSAGGAAAGQTPRPPAAEQERERVVNVQPDDAEMNAAKLRAISELPDFYRHLANPGRGERGFMIKFDIVPGDGVEYVWASDIDRSTTPITATLVSHPELTRDQAGDRVRIANADIIDWIYFRDGIAQGAYTQRVLLNHMSSAEAAELRANMGW
jgi:uncharacterized protein YegJ (DUF2314 family)